MGPDGRELRGELTLALMAVAIAVLEGLVPRPVPFLKPGLANIATIAGILRYGPWSGLRINLLRCTAAAVFSGTLVTPAFVMSLAGGISSAAVMGPLGGILSVPGLSITGSVCGMGAQLASASVMLNGLPVRSLLLPVMIWAVAAGLVTGLSAAFLLRSGFPWAGECGRSSVRRT